ncbi:hypothetical protein BGZ72_004022, partial [Mortierella alpina]
QQQRSFVPQYKSPMDRPGHGSAQGCLRACCTARQGHVFSFAISGPSPLSGSQDRRRNLDLDQEQEQEHEQERKHEQGPLLLL